MPFKFYSRSNVLDVEKDAEQPDEEDAEQPDEEVPESEKVFPDEDEDIPDTKEMSREVKFSEKDVDGKELPLEQTFTEKDVERIGAYFSVVQATKVTLSNFAVIMRYAVKDKLYSQDAIEQLFAKCDKNNEGVISWMDVLNHMTEKFEAEEYESSSSLSVAAIKLPPRIKQLQFRVRTHLDLVGMWEMTDDSILLISNSGTVVEWCLKKSQEAIVRPINKKTIPVQKVNVTSTKYIHRIGKLILANNCSELHIYDLKPVYNFICKISKLYSIPLTLECTWYEEEKFIIAFGDEEGCISCLIFDNFLTFLPNNRGVDNVDKHTYTLLTLATSGAVHYIKWKAHNSPVCNIHYIPSISAITSCSKERNKSLVIGSVLGTKRVGKFHVNLSNYSAEYTEVAHTAAETITTGGELVCPRSSEDEVVITTVRGVTHYDFSDRSQYFVTGGVDSWLRVWSIDSQSRATQMHECMGHRKPFVLVKFHEKSLNLLLSMSNDKEIRIWNTNMFTLIFTLMPYDYLIDDKVSLKAVTFSPITEKIYLVSDNVYVLQIVKLKWGKKLPFVHHATVNCVLYRPSTKTLLTGDQNGIIKFWKVVSGKYLGEFYCPTENSPITDMIIDSQDSRLVTAHEDGLVRVWNLLTAQCSKILRKNNESTITVLIYNNYQQFKWLVTAGWDRQLHFYSGLQSDLSRYQDPIFDLIDKAYYPYEGSFIMTGHILCMTEGPQNRIVIGCDDGEIHIWNVLERKMIKCLVLPPPTDFVPDTVCHACVDLRIHKMRFLLSRYRQTAFTGAVFISLGPYNMVHFWTYLIGDTKVLASFKPTVGPLKKTFSVCMDLTPDESILYTGDGRGNLFAWDISNYALTLETGPPPLKCVWNAHKEPITDIKIINCNNLYCVITASIDCTVKLWKLDGSAIGNFGYEKWKLSDNVPVTLQRMKQKDAVKEGSEIERAGICSESIERMEEKSGGGVEKFDWEEVPMERRRHAMNYVKDHIHLGAFHALEVIDNEDLSQRLKMPVKRSRLRLFKDNFVTFS